MPYTSGSFVSWSVVSIAAAIAGVAAFAPRDVAAADDAPTVGPEAKTGAWGHYWGDTVVLPGSLDKAAEIEPKAIKHGVLFVNFDGVTTMMGSDFSQADSSNIFGQTFEPHGGNDAAKTAILDAVKVDLGAYDVEIVDERPAMGDYTMAIVSPTNPAGGSVLGIAPLDCNDGQPNNIVFAFHGANDGFSPAGAAGTISHEAGHSYGLDHVDDPQDIMNPANSGGDPTFRDLCDPLVEAMPLCAMVHNQFCPDGSGQNSHQELLEIFGSSTPDTSAPVVTITSPEDGAFFEVGAAFEITVSASDDDEVRTAQLFDGDTALMGDMEAPYGWPLFDVPEGVFEFTVQATDRVGNIGTSEVVTIYIGIEPPEAADTSGTGASGGQDGGGGCGCTQDAPGARFGWLALGLLGMGLAKRRRVASR